MTEVDTTEMIQKAEVEANGICSEIISAFNKLEVNLFSAALVVYFLDKNLTKNFGDEYLDVKKLIQEDETSH